MISLQDKMIPPRYQDTPPEKIPVAETSDQKVRVKVIAGESLGQFGPSQQTIKLGEVAMLEKGDELSITAPSTSDCRVLLLAGTPLKEPIVRDGPFIMNTKEQIEQAKKDYKEGRLGKIDGMEERMEQTERARQQQKNTGAWN